MQDLPKPIPGSELLAARKAVGVQQKDLADAIGIHRTRLNAWESTDYLDAVRSARYIRALATLARKAVA